MGEAHPAGLDFLVDRADWSRTRFEEREPPRALASGRVLLRVDRFAFTANNISYAKAGDMLRYWDFFPVGPGEEGWGRLPVMGFGDVVASAHPEVEVGRRVFGFFPMSRTLQIEPARVGPGGIVDGAAHRQGIAPVYNTYSPTDADPEHDPRFEDATMLLRGLFLTSFLVDDYVAERDLGESQVIVSSASSKTGIALAWLLARRARARVVGLTSPGHADFVKGLGCYDAVVHYDDLEGGVALAPTVFVDMAGSGGVTNRLHHLLGDRLLTSCSVGATHFDPVAREQDLPGAAPEFFFAPGQIQKRSAEWGAEELQRRLTASWVAFRDASTKWLEIVRESGREAVERVYRDTLAGDASPRVGRILSLWEDS